MLLLVELAYRGLKRHFAPTYTELLQEKYYVTKQIAYKKEQNEHSQSKKVVESNVVSQAINLEAPKFDPNKNKRNIKKKTKAEEALSTYEKRDVVDQNLSAVLIRSMLRFRNLTGSQFDSAAQARNQDHDEFNPNYMNDKSKHKSPQSSSDKSSPHLHHHHNNKDDRKKDEHDEKWNSNMNKRKE